MNHNDSFARMFGEHGVQQINNTNLVKLDTPISNGQVEVTHQVTFMVPIAYMTREPDEATQLLLYYLGITEEIVNKIQDQATAQVPGIKIDAKMSIQLQGVQAQMYREAIHGMAPYCFNINEVKPQDEPNFLGDRYVGFETVISVAEGVAHGGEKVKVMTWFVAATAMVRHPDLATGHVRGGILARSY